VAPGGGTGHRAGRLTVPAIISRWRAAWFIAARITRLNVRARLEYRGDFVMALLMGLAWQSSVLVFAGVLLARFPGLGGWTQGGVLLIASMRLLSHGIYVAAFGNLWLMSTLVQEGRIDGYMLRPLPVYRQVLLAEFPMNALGDTMAAFLLFGLALAKLHLAWTPARAGYLAAGVAGGTLVEAAIQTVVSAVAFRLTVGLPWLVWVDSLISTFGSYPLKVLPGAARSILTFVLPVAFIAYLPAAVITGRVAGSGVPGWLAAASPAAGLVLFTAARMLWNWALRRYESIGG
jgi:ABC-2 type transport system permease protein